MGQKADVPRGKNFGVDELLDVEGREKVEGEEEVLMVLESAEVDLQCLKV